MGVHFVLAVLQTPAVHVPGVAVHVPAVQVPKPGAATWKRGRPDSAAAMAAAL